MKTLRLALASLLVAAACGSRSGDETCPPPPVSEIRANFDVGDLANVWPGELEVSSPESLDLVTTPARRGARSLGLSAHQGSTANGGTRAELTWDPGDRAGSTAYYAWSVWIPPDWPDIDRVKDPSGRPNWQILAQFHDQPDCQLGETWDDYAGKGQSPPISLQYFWLTREDPDVQAVFDQGTAERVVGLTEASRERPQQGLLVGVPPELRAVAPIEKGRWYDLRLAVSWSSGESGRVEWTLNDVTVVNHAGRNMLNAASHYFKVGLYRNPEIVPDQRLFLDEIFVTHDPAGMNTFAEDLASSRP